MLEPHWAVIAFRLATANDACIKAQPDTVGNDHFRKTQQKLPDRRSWEIAGIYA
ncbi:MAG TPA: hypothetical protein VMD09_04695 [Solirubrobacteraceae bacterium]|nr:hypothetical protein [Solirubrobacteraceae bacterium]